MEWVDRGRTVTDRRMGYSVYCLCDASILMDPGRIGIGMATTMRSCKERASMVLLCDMHVGVYSSPLKRGLPPPGARSAALPPARVVGPVRHGAR